MNVITVFLVCLFFVNTLMGSAQNITDEITVLSYNIHYGYGMDHKKDINRIAKVIRSTKADIIGLQEIADSTMAVQLSELTNMYVVFGPSKETMSGYGDAVLSRFPLDYVGNVSIPSASSSRYQAMCVTVNLSEKYGQDCYVRLINTHFDWKETIGSKEARKAAVEVIERAFFKDHQFYPSLLTGDLNAIPGSETIQLLLGKGWIYGSDYTPLLTEPSANPDKQIDYVMARPSKSWEILNVYVVEEPMASDHLPVLMALKLIDNN